MSAPWSREKTPLMDAMLHECPKVTEIVLRARDLERRLSHAERLLRAAESTAGNQGAIRAHLAAAREEDGK